MKTKDFNDLIRFILKKTITEKDFPLFMLAGATFTTSNKKVITTANKNTILTDIAFLNTIDYVELNDKHIYRHEFESAESLSDRIIIGSTRGFFDFIIGNKEMPKRVARTRKVKDYQRNAKYFEWYYVVINKKEIPLEMNGFAGLKLKHLGNGHTYVTYGGKEYIVLF